MPPWDKYAAEPQGPWTKRAVRQNPGTILPFSQDAEGNLQFDSDAGLVGVVKRAVTLPGDVYTGKTPPSGPETTERAVDLAAIISPAAAPLRAGEMAATAGLKAFRSEPKAPTAEALKEASTAGYNTARDMGVDYSSAAVKSMADDIQRSLEADGILAELSPKTFSILKKLQQPPDSSVASLAGLDAARKSLSHAAGDFTNRTEQLAAQRAIRQLDEFMSVADPQTVVARTAPSTGSTAVTEAGHNFRPGDAAFAQREAEAAARSLESARGNYAAAARSDRLMGREVAAELNAAAANSGANIDNAIRQRLKPILTAPKEARGYSDAELAAIERAVRGTRTQNAARYTGNLLGGGGGLGAGFTSTASGFGAATMTGDPMMAAFGIVPPVIGAGTKALASALSRRQVDKIDEMIRKRSPLYQRMKEEAPFEVSSPETRAALIRALMLYDAQRQ